MKTERLVVRRPERTYAPAGVGVSRARWLDACRTPAARHATRLLADWRETRGTRPSGEIGKAACVCVNGHLRRQRELEAHGLRDRWRLAQMNRPAARANATSATAAAQPMATMSRIARLRGRRRPAPRSRVSSNRIGVADIAQPPLRILLETAAQQRRTRCGHARRSGSSRRTAARMSVMVSPLKSGVPVSIS